MMRQRFAIAFPLLLIAFLFTACSDDDNPTTPPNDSPDFFPFNREIVWTYETNLFKNELGPQPAIMEVKIDTAWSSDQMFDWLAVRVPSYSTEWNHILAVLDSAGTIYSLGDNPREGLYPMFKHQYEENEIERETISIKGTSYETVKITVEGEHDASVTWWFADGIGLVREHSLKGLSIFSDDNDDEVLTELVSYTR